MKHLKGSFVIVLLTLVCAFTVGVKAAAAQAWDITGNYHLYWAAEDGIYDFQLNVTSVDLQHGTFIATVPQAYLTTDWSIWNCTFDGANIAFVIGNGPSVPTQTCSSSSAQAVPVPRGKIVAVPQIYTSPFTVTFSGQVSSNGELGGPNVEMCTNSCWSGWWGEDSTYSNPGHARLFTNTTLSVSSNGAPVTTVDSGSVVTLTATVTTGTEAVTPGQVKFCDATAAYCTDTHLLGTAQLTTNGMAMLSFRPGIGNHSYKAVFQGVTLEDRSSSSDALLTVTGLYPTVTSITQSGSPGNYTLTAIVEGNGSMAPTGMVSFLDTNSNNVVLGTAMLEAGAPRLSFLNSSSPTTGAQPTFTATADLNGDGIPDLVVANNGACGSTVCLNGSVSVLLGNGDGTFTTVPESPVTGAEPWAIVVEDFNGDGIPDLAVASANCTPSCDNDSTVMVLLGNGDGTFAQAPTISSGGVADPSIAVGDFNGDGIPDLVMGNEFSRTLSIFLGNGDGTFTAGANLDGGIYPLSIVVGDFNGDGNLDLAAADDDSNTVTILLGNGDGTFTAAPVSPATGNYPTAIVVGDFNRDGILDIAVANYLDASDPFNNGSITILLGNGDGTFTPAPSLAAGGSPFSIASGDFNGDGILDLVIANNLHNTLTVFLGNGDGTFAAPSIVGTGSGPLVIAVADFNGDGVADLAAGNSGSNNATVLLTENQIAQAISTSISPSGMPQNFVEASYSGDNNYNSSVSPTVSLQGQTRTPMISLSAGTYTSPQSITITDPTPGPTIYYSYTTNGTSPTAPFVEYTTPITVAASGTLEAYAVANGYVQSALATASYIFTKPTPTITWHTPSAIKYGKALGTTQLDAKASVAGTFVYSPKAGTVLGAGPQTLSVTFTPNNSADYAMATATVTLTVNPAALTVTAKNNSMTYGASVPAFTYSLSGFVNGDTAASAVTGAPELATAATPLSSVGAYAITATAGSLSAANYTFSFKNGTLTIDQVKLKATAASVSIPYASVIPGLTYSLSGFVNGDTQASATTGAPILSTAATSTSPVGKYPITIAAGTLASVDYKFTFTNGTLTITKALPAVNWPTPASIVYGTALGITQQNATSPVSGTFRYTPAAGTVPKAGTQTLTVNFTPTDTADYTTAKDSVSLIVNKASQTISFTPPSSPVVYGSKPIALSATSSSGLTVGFSIVSGPGKITGKTLKITGAGTIVVAANQAGNADYAAATQVTQTVVVVKPG